MSTTIAIVGAGPVGLVAALRLARAGHAVTVPDAEPDISEELRASTFHPPTLDMLDTLGLAAPLIAQGLVTPTWQVRAHETGDRAVFDLGVLGNDTAFPNRLQAEQHKLSRLLLAALAKAGGDVRFGHRVADVSQDADGVAVAGEGFALRAAWVIGCDGARSRVRAAMGEKFQGETHPETTILATRDFPFHEALPGPCNVNQVWTESAAFAGTFSLLRVPEKWRAGLYPAPGEAVKDALKASAIERKPQAIHPKHTPYHVPGLRPYRVHQRIVDTYRAGRLLLAGGCARV